MATKVDHYYRNENFHALEFSHHETMKIANETSSEWRIFQEELKKKHVFTNAGLQQILPGVIGRRATEQNKLSSNSEEELDHDDANLLLEDLLINSSSWDLRLSNFAAGKQHNEILRKIPRITKIGLGGKIGRQ